MTGSPKTDREHDDDIRDQARHLARELPASAWTLAALLSQVRREEAWRRWGLGSFTEWARRELDMSAQTARNLGALHDWFVDHPLPPELNEQLKQLPWTKAIALVGHCTSRNASVMLDDVRGLARNEVPKRVREIAALSDAQLAALAYTPRERFRKVEFSLADDGAAGSQFDIVEQALALAAKTSRSEKLGHNLAMICLEFLATSPSRDWRAPLADAHPLAWIERLLGLRVIAFGPSGRLAYGHDKLHLIEAAKDDT